MEYRRLGTEQDIRFLGFTFGDAGISLTRIGAVGTICQPLSGVFLVLRGQDAGDKAGGGRERGDQDGAEEGEDLPSIKLLIARPLQRRARVHERIPLDRERYRSASYQLPNTWED
jgi:hypothetical protein